MDKRNDWVVKSRSHKKQELSIMQHSSLVPESVVE